jgi:hypothetical protein
MQIRQLGSRQLQQRGVLTRHAVTAHRPVAARSRQAVRVNVGLEYEQLRGDAGAGT